MVREIKTALALTAIVAVFGPQSSRAQRKQQAKTLETGTFHGKVHQTSGRATIYQEENGKLVLRLTNFKTSNGPDVHVILIAAKDADDDANFLKSDTQRVELGKLKGNEGDQNYEIPAWHGSRQIPNGLDLLRTIQRKFWRRTFGEVLSPELRLHAESGSPKLPDSNFGKEQTMIAGAGSWLSRKKWILASIGVPVLVAAWWAFRPEKLWINKQVSEPAPFASSSDSQPLYTGLLMGKAHPTSGRASIYQLGDGKRDLRLTDFTTSNGPDVHVLLAQSTDQNLTKEFVKGDLDSVELAF